MESKVDDRSCGNPKDATELQRICHEKQEKRSDYHKSRAHNLAITFIFYQALIFLSLSRNNNSSIQCRHWWIPFSMSLFPTIVFCIAFADAVTSFYRAQYQLDLNCIEQQMMRRELQEANRSVIGVLKPDGFLLFKRLLFIWTTVLALLAFTAVVLCSCRFMLCN